MLSRKKRRSGNRLLISLSFAKLSESDRSSKVVISKNGFFNLDFVPSAIEVEGEVEVVVNISAAWLGKKVV